MAGRMDAETVLQYISARVFAQQKKLAEALTPDDRPDQWEDAKTAARIDGETVKLVKGVLENCGWWNLKKLPEPKPPGPGYPGT